MLFEEPTVEHLAAALRGHRAEGATTTVLPVHPAGSGRRCSACTASRAAFSRCATSSPRSAPTSPLFGLWTPQVDDRDATDLRIEDVAVATGHPQQERSTSASTSPPASCTKAAPIER